MGRNFFSANKDAGEGVSDSCLLTDPLCLMASLRSHSIKIRANCYGSRNSRKYNLFRDLSVTLLGL